MKIRFLILSAPFACTLFAAAPAGVNFADRAEKALKGTVRKAETRDRRLGVTFRNGQANALRIRMQNGTDSRRMRVWWQTCREPTWDLARSVAFDVTPRDVDDAVYTVPMPEAGAVKQMKIAFSSDGEPVTGTVRLDYIWAGRLP